MAKPTCLDEIEKPVLSFIHAYEIIASSFNHKSINKN